MYSFVLCALIHKSLSNNMASSHEGFFMLREMSCYNLHTCAKFKGRAKNCNYGTFEGFWLYKWHEERLQALKLQPLGKRRLSNDLVLTHKILHNLIDLEVLQKARTKTIINKTASSNRENPQKTKQFCVQGC